MTAMAVRETNPNFMNGVPELLILRLLEQEEMYGYEASSATISAVTDKLIPIVQEWRIRPLEAVYPIVFMDAMFFKTRQDNLVKTKVMYNIMGINADGRKEILGVGVGIEEGLVVRTVDIAHHPFQSPFRVELVVHA